MTTINDFHSIIEFWFGSSLSQKTTIEAKSPLWWKKSSETDAEILTRFEVDLIRFNKGELEHWKTSAEGWLALIILSDQFPRNMYRDSAKAFAYDELALALCLEGIERNLDTQLNSLQRVFFYLPLEHAESRAMQERSVMMQAQLLDSIDDSLKKAFQGFYNYALAHQKVIEEFDRFPHRNRILGRHSSGAELAYLAQPGSGF